MSSALKYITNYTVADYMRWEGDWELMDGVASDMGPSPYEPHGELLGEIVYRFKHALHQNAVRVFTILIEIDWIVDEHTVVRPDMQLKKGRALKGHSVSTPVLIVEILSPSTREKDRTWKFDLYRKQGVLYYLMVDPDETKLEIFRLVDGQYEMLPQPERPSFELSDECSLEIDLSKMFE